MAFHSACKLRCAAPRAASLTAGRSRLGCARAPGLCGQQSSCGDDTLTQIAQGAAGVLAVAISIAAGVTAWSSASADPRFVALELNKLEPQEKGCRAYLVVNNHTDAAFQSVKLDLVMFQSDGVIGRRFALELAPLRPKKRTVKLFDLDGVACERVGNFLLNDVIECQTDSGPVGDCLARLEVSALGPIQLAK